MVITFHHRSHNKARDCQRIILATPAQLRLLTVGELSAQFLGFRFEPGCWMLVEEVLSSFDPQTMPPHDPAAAFAISDDVRLRLAEARVAEWVSAMVQEAIRRGYADLREPTFGAVQLRLCPFWPFC